MLPEKGLTLELRLKSLGAHLFSSLLSCMYPRSTLGWGLCLSQAFATAGSFKLLDYVCISDVSGIWKFYKGSTLHISALQRVYYKGALLLPVVLDLNNPTSYGIFD